MNSFVPGLVRQLQEVPPKDTRRRNADFPAYDLRDALDRDLVVSRGTPQSFHLGTGASLFTNVLIPAITSATSEIILVTCFWAPSKTLSALHDALARLAVHRRQLITESRSTGIPISPLTVRICFSSRSVLQKLFHPQSRHGYLYPPSTWKKDLGLPDPQLLEAGAIDLRAKTLFFLPFSVMHPKFVIVDRQRAFVPSCNVSWESWLEGCLELTGDAVTSLMSFYARTWDPDLDFQKPLATEKAESQVFETQVAGLETIASPAHRRLSLPATAGPLPTLVLPSSHHTNPQFRFPWQTSAPVPKTPLNIALLRLFDHARESIYLQTPNLTCEPVLTALLDAISRGVDVTIVTNRSMMILEQLVTAGTTTSWCIRSLVRRFRRLQTVPSRRSGGLRLARNRRETYDLEAGSHGLGKLCILSFRARQKPTFHSQEAQPLASSGNWEEEPVHSHFKLAIADSEFTMLGSGNMDRASWYTSQELGILIHDHGFAESLKAGVERVLDGRLDVIFDSQEIQSR